MPNKGPRGLDAHFPGAREFIGRPMPVQFVEPEPDEYDKGDGLQRHMAMDDVEWPGQLGAVLRDDGPEKIRVSRAPEPEPKPAPMSAWRHIWYEHHEWIACLVIIFVALFICFG